MTATFQDGMTVGRQLFTLEQRIANLEHQVQFLTERMAEVEVKDENGPTPTEQRQR